MDDKDKKFLEGGGAGALIGGVFGGPPGAVIGGAIGAVWNSQESKHHSTVRDTAYAIAESADDTGILFVDHITPDGSDDGGTANVVDGLSHHPDIVYKAATYNSLVIEVETGKSLNKEPGEALSQLNDFSVPGYRRTLVVPPSDLEDAQKWINHHRSETGRLDNNKLYLRAPEDVVDLL